MRVRLEVECPLRSDSKCESVLVLIVRMSHSPALRFIAHEVPASTTMPPRMMAPPNIAENREERADGVGDGGTYGVNKGNEVERMTS